MVEVTEHDPYMHPAAAAYRPQFDPFIRNLEAIERRYASTHAQKDLLDLLLTMAAQVPDIRAFMEKWLEIAQWVERGIQAVDIVTTVQNYASGQPAERFVSLVRRLARAVLDYAELLHERDVGELEVPVSRVRPKDPSIPVGSLDHFMRVSHSVSRDDVYPGVLLVWLDQMMPQRGRATRRQGG